MLIDEHDGMERVRKCAISCYFIGNTLVFPFLLEW